MGNNIVIDTEKVNNKTNKTITIVISEFQEDDEVLDNNAEFATVTTEMTTNDTA